MSDYQELFSKYKIPAALSLVGLVLIFGGYFSSKNTPGSSSSQSFPKESLVTKTEALLSVDVSGQVSNPGVYQLKNGERIEDAIEMAGGFTSEANKEYISKYLNLAQKITDGSKIYIPSSQEDLSSQAKTIGQVAGSINTKVSLNSASQEELEKLPGIGPVTASRIISDRPFNNLDELVVKKILSKSTFEKIKESIILN